MNIFFRWIIQALALLAIANIVPGIELAGPFYAFVVALLLALVNLTFKPILILLTLPFNILTLGLFTFVINAFLIWFVAGIADGFSITGFMPAFVAALLLSIVNALVNWTNNDVRVGQ
ncbi:MAG: phage holin family protein [Patescibacteria group bacterium]